MTWHHVALILIVLTLVALVGVQTCPDPQYKSGVLNLATIVCSATLGHAGAQRSRTQTNTHDAGNNINREN